MNRRIRAADLTEAVLYNLQQLADDRLHLDNAHWAARALWKGYEARRSHQEDDRLRRELEERRKQS